MGMVFLFAFWLRLSQLPWYTNCLELYNQQFGEALRANMKTACVKTRTSTKGIKTTHEHVQELLEHGRRFSCHSGRTGVSRDLLGSAGCPLSWCSRVPPDPKLGSKIIPKTS